MSFNSRPEIAGFKILHMPKIYIWAYNQEGNGITPQDFARKNGYVESEAIRVYESDGDEALVIFPRLRHSLAIPKVHADISYRSEFDQPTLSAVYRNNQESMKMRGIRSDQLAELKQILYGLPLSVYLSGYWCLMEKISLFHIAQKNFAGISQTDQGLLPLNSW